jgi:hypothetical protein
MRFLLSSLPFLSLAPIGAATLRVPSVYPTVPEAVAAASTGDEVVVAWFAG